jgi:elongation factor Ts
MHIAAMNPIYISLADILPAAIAEVKIYLRVQARNEHKPEAAIASIVDGKLKIYYQNICLLEQPYFKSSDKSVNDVIVECIAMLKKI